MDHESLDVIKNLHPQRTAFPYQIDWIKDDSKYKLGTKARQIGITTSEAITRFVECMFWKECELEPFPPVIIFASPSQRQSSRLMNYIQRARALFERYYKTKVTFKKEREDHLYFGNFAEIWSLPNNPRTIEGIDGSHGIIDELGNFGGREDQEVYSALTGSLAAKGGGMTLFGRPRGRRGLFWALYDPLGKYSKEYSIHDIDWTKRAACDPLYKKTVEEQKLILPDLAFREQYMCEFVDENIVIYPWELLDRATNDLLGLWTDESKLNTKNPLYMGIDFGKKINRTVITIIEDRPGRARLKYIFTTQDDYNVQLEQIVKLIERFKITTVTLDETGMGLPMLDFLVSKFGELRIQGFNFSRGKELEKMILDFRNILSENKFEMPADSIVEVRTLMEQLHGIEKAVLDSGRAKYTGKRTDTDWQDDSAWSLILGCSKLGNAEWSMQVANVGQVKHLSDREQFARDVDEEGNAL